MKAKILYTLAGIAFLVAWWWWWTGVFYVMEMMK
jgi:hypothetical protein